MNEKTLTAAMDNSKAWKLGAVAKDAGNPKREGVGDMIDRGLILNRLLNENGFGVVDLETNDVAPPVARSLGEVAAEQLWAEDYLCDPDGTDGVLTIGLLQEEVATIINTVAASLAPAGTDTQQLNYLSDLLTHCPDTKLSFNDNPDVEEPIGFTIRVQGCETSEVTAPTLRECLDKEIGCAQRSEWPTPTGKRLILIGAIPTDPSINGDNPDCPYQHIMHQDSAGENAQLVYALREPTESAPPPSPSEEEVAREAGRLLHKRFAGIRLSSANCNNDWGEVREIILKVLRNRVQTALETLKRVAARTQNLAIYTEQADPRVQRESLYEIAQWCFDAQQTTGQSERVLSTFCLPFNKAENRWDLSIAPQKWRDNLPWLSTDWEWRECYLVSTAK